MFTLSGQSLGHWPTSPSNVSFKYTVLGIPKPELSIQGPSVVCTSGVYTIENLPLGATVAWSSTWNSAPYPQLVHNSPNPNELTINNVYMYPSSTTLTATVNVNCGPSIILAKQIGSDYYSTYQTGTYSQEGCWVNNQYQQPLSGSLPSGGTPLYLHQGCMTQITLSNMGGKTITFTGTMQPTYWNYDSSTSKLWLQMPVGSGGIPFTFKISGTGVCQDKYLLFFSYLSSSSFAYEVSPNPVSETLSINVALNDQEVEQKGVEQSVSDLEFQACIYDISDGSLLIQPRDFKGALRHEIDVSRLPPGIYSLRIRQGQRVQSIKFIKE
jgi:hypothetical protein